MKTIEMLKALFAHMEWADGAVWQAVLASDTAREDKDLRDRLHHLHLVQYAFLHVWLGAPFDAHVAASYEAAQLAEWAASCHAELQSFLSSFDPQRLDEPMPMPWAARAAERMGRPAAGVTTIGETMIQVASHSTHHRGQAAMRLRQLGVEPPLTDFIAWVWLGKPEA